MNGFIAKVSGGFTLTPNGDVGLGGVWIQIVNVDYTTVSVTVWTLGM